MDPYTWTHANIYLNQFCVDTGYSLEDLPGAMDHRDGPELSMRLDDDDDDEEREK